MHAFRSPVWARGAWRALLTTLLIACVAVAQAQDGVSANEILIGQTAGFTGQVSSQVKEQTAAVRAYFAYVNQRGGVHGRKLVLKSIDDGYDAKRAAANARKLIAEDHVFVLAFSRGTPTTEALVPVLEEYRVPLIGPATGAQSLYEPVNRYVFNVRAKYRTEAMRIIEHLARVQSTRIAVLYQNNSFGQDALAGYEQGLADQNLKPVVIVALDGAKPEKDVAAAVEKIVAANPQAVAIAGPLKPTAEFIRALRAKGSFAQCSVLSNLSADAFITELGDAAPGVIVTQVVPFPWNAGIPLAKELQQVLRAEPEPGATLSYASMEGFIYAKVLVEALRRAGANPTRDKLIAALENMRSYDLGGFTITFGPRRREGSTYIDITMIGKDRKFIR